MLPLLVPGWFWLGYSALMAVTQAQSTPGFYPSRILLTGTNATSFLVGNTTSISLYLTVVTNTTVVPTPECSGRNHTSDWFLTLESTKTANMYMVTLNLNRSLCSTNETNCCTESLCIVETLQVSACENGTAIASFLIQAEIYVNNTSTGPLSVNATVIPNQAYQPLGPCPCNLTAGACDVGCCCDQECTSNMIALFNGFCYTGVFGGNITPPFDQLCSSQAQFQVPDWFPFLCVQSSMNNSPFLGYFYQGSTVSTSQQAIFNMSFQSSPVGVTTGYKQGDAILIAQNGYNEYFKIPQQSTIGVCESNAPVAYLQNFNTSCVRNLTACSSALKTNFNQSVMDGIGGTININVQQQSINSDNYLTVSGIALPEPTNCTDVIVSAEYTFVWESNKIREINVTVITTSFKLEHQAILIQRFASNFVTNNSASAILSGNPGYLVGKPVIVANGSSPLVRSTMNLWQPVGDSSCSSATQTPVLFGQDSFSGCILNVFNKTCSQLRETVPVLLKSLVPADYIAVRGNSNFSDLSEWVTIIYEVPSAPCTNCTVANVKCLSIPANLNIQIMTAVTGKVEGIPQAEILAAKISFSTVNADCVINGTLSLPISTSVQFVNVPAQAPPRTTSFQVNYTEYDCERNDVCWQKLAYPLTQYYTGEPHHLTLAKGMILVFFFIVTAVLGGPWNRIRRAWNNK